MKCTRAIIGAGGYGTRRLPITKAINKTMLPIMNRPIIDYSVQDCIRAGITDIYFVAGKDSDEIRKYYSHNVELENYLKRTNHIEALNSILPPDGINFHFVEQRTDDKYGSAVPVALCREMIPSGESVVICMGDDCLYSPNAAENDISRLVNASESEAAMLGVLVEREIVGRYGVIQTDDHGNFVQIVEKPKPEEAPSNLINVSKFVFTSDLLDETTRYVETKKSDGEYYIIDAINSYVANGGVLRVLPAVGEYLDAGTTEGWLRANQFVATHS